nr:kelch repeat-containing protein [Pseudoalteromonas luteoviolacea]
MSSILYRYALNQSNANSTNPDAELTQLLNALEADFGEDGVIDDTLLLESLRATIPEIDPSLVSSNLDDWIDGVDGFVKVDINEYLDTDLDGIFNSIDTDDDNDGVKDELDPSPYQQSFIVADQAVEGNEDQSIEVDIETNNPLGIEVRVEVTTSPSNGVVSGNYPTLRYSPNANFEGSDTFSYRLRQGEISSEIVTVKVSVIGENDAPLISGTPGTEILAYNAYSFVPTISDIENDSLEFSVQNLPSWASFNSLTGEVAGTPSNENVGVFPEIIISVTDGESSAQLKAFDLEVVSNPWQVLPNLPTYRRGPEGVEINGKIYVLGGLDQNNKHMSDMDVFDTSNKSWELMASMQTARWSHTANTVDNQIYAIGGQSTISIGGNSTINSVEVFNLETQRWTAGASMGTPRDNHSSCVYDGEIYVFGGRNGPTTLTTVEKYNPVDDSWSYRESNSNLGWGSQCVTFGDEIYVFGGASNEKGFEVYDPVSDLWVRSGVLNQPMRYGFSVEAIDQNIYIIGGYIARDTVHVFDTVSSTWSENTAMPIGKQSMGSVMLNGAIYLFGGINGSVDNVPSFEKYDPAFEKK